MLSTTTKGFPCRHIRTHTYSLSSNGKADSSPLYISTRIYIYIYIYVLKLIFFWGWGGGAGGRVYFITWNEKQNIWFFPSSFLRVLIFFFFYFFFVEGFFGCVCVCVCVCWMIKKKIKNNKINKLGPCAVWYWLRWHQAWIQSAVHQFFSSWTASCGRVRATQHLCKKKKQNDLGYKL